MKYKYKGVVYKRNRHGRNIFKVRFQYDNVRYEFGSYADEKEAAKAYDIFVIKMGIDRPLNFFKKILA